jgi:hypothetical protein
VALVPGDAIVGSDAGVSFLSPSGEEFARRNLAEPAARGLLEGGLLQAGPGGDQQLEITVHEHIYVVRCTRAFHVDPGEQIIVHIDDVGELVKIRACAGHDESVDEWAARGAGPAGEPYVGLTQAEAEARAHEAGLTTRIVGRDGADLLIPDDVLTNRLNLMIFADVVVAARLDTE